MPHVCVQGEGASISVDEFDVAKTLPDCLALSLLPRWGGGGEGGGEGLEKRGNLHIHCVLNSCRSPFMCACECYYM